MSCYIRGQTLEPPKNEVWAGHTCKMTKNLFQYSVTPMTIDIRAKFNIKITELGNST